MGEGEGYDSLGTSLPYDDVLLPELFVEYRCISCELGLNIFPCKQCLK